ncbi:MAG TPA: xanthine dehydrogenase family protein molybdopterin-binding subunit [Bacilli bacterium]|nr:xanthine dehydrogenase family protein molybdopterin-binding subunit [Bacilli bacterium]
MFDKSKSSPKIDHDEKCSGSARYVSDIQIDGMLFAKTVRSPITKGIIRSIAIPALPDGYYIVDHHDILSQNFVKMIYKDWPVFAVDEVNYIGEPIMLVVGPDKAVLETIIANIKIGYEETEPTFGFTKSAVTKGFKKGDVESAFSKAKTIIEETFETGYQEQAYIEPQGMLGYPEGDKITLIGSIQCPYYVKNAVLNCLGYPEDQVRVIQPPVGGAFGGKEEFPSTIACQLATAIAKIKQPIKLIFEREEDMLVTTKRHPSITKMRAALDSDNRVIGLSAEVSIDGGAYIGLSGVVLSRALIAVTGAYTIPNLTANGNVYITNTVPTGAFRGFGAPQMMFAIEMMMNHIPKRLGLDPLEFRLKHLAKQGDLTSTSGLFRDPIIMPKMIDKAIQISDYKQKMEKYAHDATRGIGMSFFLHGCGFTGSGETTIIKAKVKLRKDEHDQVYVLVAAVDMGQGCRTSLHRVVYQTMDLPPQQVTFDYPDTDDVPDSGPTVASRTMMIVGGLLARASLKLKQTWKPGIKQEIIEQYVQPSYVVWDEDKLQGDAYPAYSWGVNVVEVSVCPLTYQVKLEGIWSVYDVGKTIDERIVIGQADGGIAQGVAYGYLEVMEAKQGKLKQKNFTDYIIPTSLDMAPTETVLYDNPFAYGPYGAKGVGELTLVGGAPAVAMAIENAIRRPINRIPATPELIMETLGHE